MIMLISLNRNSTGLGIISRETPQHTGKFVVYIKLYKSVVIEIVFVDYEPS